jgi:hypothetical protein
MNFYDCSVCRAINHAGRLHCQVCGTIPACYSMTGKPSPSIVPAFGCERQGIAHIQRLKFVTVELDYYADTDLARAH